MHQIARNRPLVGLISVTLLPNPAIHPFGERAVQGALLLRRFLLITLAGSCSVFGQNYTISTIAGGGKLPVNIPGATASIGGPSGLAVDAKGNVFISLAGSHIVVRLDAATGILTLVAGNGVAGFSGDGGPATSAQLNNPYGVALDSAGSLYITDFGNNRIRKVSGGVITTVAGGGSSFGDNGPATSAQLYWTTGVAVDSSGNLYIADYGNNRVRKVSNGVITTVAGNGSWTFAGDNGPATSAQVSPFAIAVDSVGNLYIADYGNSRIRKVTNGVITTLAGNGTAGFAGDNGPAVSAQLDRPIGVAVDSAGNVYIADMINGNVGNNSRVSKVSDGVITTVAWHVFPDAVAVDSAGNLYMSDRQRVLKVSNGVSTTIAGTGLPPSTGFSGDNGPATSAQLYGTVGVAVDQAGAVYIADIGNHRIRKVSNGVITTVAGSGGSGFGGDNGPATSAQFDPYSVAVDSSGILYIADYINRRVRKVSDGVITTVAGSGTGGFSGDGGPATSARMYFPTGVAVDRDGNLYIADSGAQRVRKVSKGVITTVAGNGATGSGGDNGPATTAQFNNPMGLAVDAAGNLYIADWWNHRVRKVSGGVITTVAGNGTLGFSGDGGPATSAQLNYPYGVAVDAAGNLYIADRENNRVRRVSGGVITTVAGNGTGGFSGDGGPAASAELSYPEGVAVDSAGNVYIADTNNSRLRVLTPSPCTYSASPTALQAPLWGGSLTVSVQTTASCQWAISGLPNWITVSGTASVAGPATITFVIAANTGAARSAAVSVAGVSIPVAQDAFAPVPSISTGGVVNSASSAGGAPLAPGSLATAYGSFLLPTGASAASTPLPTALLGLSMQFGANLPAPLFYAGAMQVNLQVPWEVAGQSQVALTATLGGRPGPALTVSLAPYSPGIFSTNSQGTGQGDIFDLSYRLVDSTNPATAGSTYVQIYATGLGAVSNTPRSGSASPGSALAETTTTPLVTIGGAPAPVSFSGLAPGLVGVYQVNVQVPAAASRGAAVPVVLTIGGTPSNTVSMAVQ
jgi:uncharacterized protein (TIGR03437 family)